MKPARGFKRWNACWHFHSNFFSKYFKLKTKWIVELIILDQQQVIQQTVDRIIILLFVSYYCLCACLLIKSSSQELVAANFFHPQQQLRHLYRPPRAHSASPSFNPGSDILRYLHSVRVILNGLCHLVSSMWCCKDAVFRMFGQYFMETFTLSSLKYSTCK